MRVLMPRSVKLGLMDKEQAQKRAKELLGRVGLPDKADAYPAMLSGGQKQRIAIFIYNTLDRNSCSL